jgi:murein DD-endopeptidase MepM/ murein hydrolase activator NlpD
MQPAADLTTPTRHARRVLAPMIFMAMLGFAAAWAWRQPFLDAPRMLWRISRMPPATVLPSPVQGVPARAIAPTFGAPRGSSRTHAGVDIFARRGTPVRSTTPGIVISIREGGLGGKQVWILGPGRERHYYAHLDGWAQGLREGQTVAPGALLGHVGTTGNARGTPPHLHYGIYGPQGARDPLPALRAWPGQAPPEQ